MTNGKETYFERGREFYTANDQPVWPSRYRELPDMRDGKQKGRLKDDALVQTILHHLDQHEVMSRPSLGDISSKSKDLDAFSALSDATNLLRYAARWALDHQIGTAIEGRELVPLLPSQTRELPEYKEARAAVDSHLHELTGADFKYSADTDPVLARRIAINILAPIAGSLRLPPDFVDALKALEYGEVYPIFEPAASKDQVRYREARFQLQAVAFVAYQVARGMRIGKAQAMVADAFGVSQHTLRGWEKSARDKLGQLEVSAAISRARNYASTYAEQLKKHFQGDEFAHPEDFDEGPAEHRSAGKKYKRFLGFSALRE